MALNFKVYFDALWCGYIYCVALEPRCVLLRKVMRFVLHLCDCDARRSALIFKMCLAKKWRGTSRLLVRIDWDCVFYVKNKVTAFHSCFCTVLNIKAHLIKKSGASRVFKSGASCASFVSFVLTLKMTNLKKSSAVFVSYCAMCNETRIVFSPNYNFTKKSIRIDFKFFGSSLVINNAIRVIFTKCIAVILNIKWINRSV